MASWSDLVTAEPDFAHRVRRVFDARKHKTMATLRKDGSPRISGIEVTFADGEAGFGMMTGSVKVADLGRDPRMALHVTSDDPPEGDPAAWVGDAKIAGRAVELDAEVGDAGRRFRVDITEVVLTRVGSPADHLVIESWHPGRGLVRRERR